MSTSVRSSQFHQKSARWKFSQQLCSATRKGTISKLIFLSLVPSADLGTTNFVRGAVLYPSVLWCGSLEPPLPYGYREIKYLTHYMFWAIFHTKSCLVINTSMPCKTSCNPSHYLLLSQGRLVVVFSLKFFMIENFWVFFFWQRF